MKVPVSKAPTQRTCKCHLLSGRQRSYIILRTGGVVGVLCCSCAPADVPMFALMHISLFALVHVPMFALVHGPMVALVHVPMFAFVHGPMVALVHVPMFAFVHGPMFAHVHGAMQRHLHMCWMQCCATCHGVKKQGCPLHASRS
jgi:hypothetical protein